MGAERDFWRLLSEYERLTQNEACALKSEDFAEVEALQECKSSLLGKLGGLLNASRLDRSDEELLRRVASLIESEKRHEKMAGSMLAGAAARKRAIEAARSRLRELGTLYDSDKSERRSFSALV